VEFKRGSINEPQDTAFDHPVVDAFIAESTTRTWASRVRGPPYPRIALA
jgi:hypothetical protein